MYILPDDIKEILKIIQAMQNVWNVQYMHEDIKAGVLLKLRKDLYQQYDKLCLDYKISENEDGDYSMVLPVKYAHMFNDVVAIVQQIEEILRLLSESIRKVMRIITNKV